jgi:hypothetical protein
MPRTRKKEPAEGAVPSAPAAEQDQPAAPRSRRRKPAQAGAADPIQEQMGDLSSRVEELRRQASETRADLQTLQGQAVLEVSEHRQQVRAAHQDFQQEIIAVMESLRRQAASTQGQANDITMLFQQAGQHLHGLPRQAEEVRRRLAELTRRVPDAERVLQGIELEVYRARQRLNVILEATAESERRLAALNASIQGAEARLHLIHAQVEWAEHQARSAHEKAGVARQEAREATAAVEAVAAETRNRLGVTVDPGVVVAEVMPDSPAIGCLAPGDIINAVNGTPILTGFELRKRILGIADGEEATLKVTRAGQSIEVRTRLADHSRGEEPAESHNRLGVTVVPGVVVAEVQPCTPAEAAGLSRGDVISSVNGTPVTTSEQLRQMVLHLPEHTEVELQVRRGEAMRDMRARLDDAPEAVAAGAGDTRRGRG